ncbi:hypothetical protein FEDK69T_02180 [Flavobacterium enshiense DK69]|uniref:PEGA domain-containing protein n=1 Tax=Flavobacterium enshiense TaxID=1341165 RepID=UPI0003C59F3E|nr:PEGA domain-containing protein [Flavobacterium enshiense]ESU25029.1 hypothetical protein FEDK69T_02180 [Flavobacterium enshiense DK69]
MKNILQKISGLIVATILLSSCSSTTIIQSTPPGADVYIDSQKKGTTPLEYSDTKIVGSSTAMTLKKEGYKDLIISLGRDERADVVAIISGCFVLVPFLWTMKYDPIHNYELVPQTAQNYQAAIININSNSTDELIKLKTLLEKDAITKDDFTSLKANILNNDYDYNNSIAEEIIKLRNLFDSNLLTKEEYISQKNKLVRQN